MRDEVNRAARTRSRKGDVWEFQLLMVATYPIFLAISLLRSLTGRRHAAADGRPRSIFAEARADASSTIALAFMG